MFSRRWRDTVFAFALAATLSGGIALSAAASATRVVEIKDDCDPVTFNAAGIPCVGDGETTVAQLIAELTATRVAEDWEFDPAALTIAKGDTLVAKNEGGETHTFTKVVKFGGGGLVPLLDQLSGNLVPAVPAENVFATFVPAGGSRQVPSNLLTTGQNRFMCFIHPWMRTVVTVTP